MKKNFCVEGIRILVFPLLERDEERFFSKKIKIEIKVFDLYLSYCHLKFRP